MSESIGNETAEFVSEFSVLDESVAQRDEGNRNLSGSFVGTPDDSALFHGGMFQQHSFHFRGGNGEALVLDHFFAAVNDAIEAFAVAGDNISGPVPAVRAAPLRSA